MALQALTADQLEALQNWGNGLMSEGGSEELRAAGRAITMLIDELARVQREHWHERVGVPWELEADRDAPVAQEGPFREPARATLSPQPV